MAFDKTKFNPGADVSRGEGAAVHGYISADALATIEADGYFDTIAGLFKTGDLLAVVSTGAVDADNEGGGVALYRVTATASDVALKKIADDKIRVPFRIADASTAGQTYVPIPEAGKVTKVISVLGGAITVADATLTVKDNAGNSMGTITIANASSAAGDTDELQPASNNDVTKDDFVEVETDGGSTDAAEVMGYLEITRDQ